MNIIRDENLGNWISKIKIDQENCRNTPKNIFFKSGRETVGDNL